MGDLKISRKRLALTTGISRPSLAKKLDAHVAFTYDELTRVVAAIGVPWEQLFTQEDTPLAAKPVRIRDFKARKDRTL